MCVCVCVCLEERVVSDSIDVVYVVMFVADKHWFQVKYIITSNCNKQCKSCKLWLL